MNLSYMVHLKNKYPKCQVKGSDDSIDVMGPEGEHLLALRKNGAGQMLDQSAVLGCSDVFDLSPLPRAARLFKIKDGKISKDEDYESRMKAKDEFLADMKILSCEEAKALGYEFDSKGDVSKSPKK